MNNEEYDNEIKDILQILELLDHKLHRCMERTLLIQRLLKENETKEKATSNVG